MILETKAEIWEKRIIEMKANGKPQKQWCEENGIKYNTIRSWIGKVSGKATGIQLKQCGFEK